MENHLPNETALIAIHHNLMAQRANNEARIRELRRYAMPGFAAVFDWAPVLLNCNEANLPGFVDDPATPFGLRFIEKQLWIPPEQRGVAEVLRQPENPAVESLLLIGSSGSVGHTASSDLDYWVCYDPQRLQGRPLELFQRKLAAISQWARQVHDTEANFYAVDLKELAAGRISSLQEAEIEGEVAPRLLLDELYRTILHVAGRPALWQIVPPNIEREEYQSLCEFLTAGFDAPYVDLGFPARPAPQEFLAAALWLARKSEADPFKGIMKIVSILEYVEMEAPLLCNTIKAAIFTADPARLPVDPYVLTIDAISEYGVRSLTPEQLELLRSAAALKVLGSAAEREVFVMPKNSPKRLVLEERAARWGWDANRLTELTNYSRWPERARLKLGEELLAMLSSIYVRIAHYLRANYPGEVNPQNGELAPLAARLLARRGGLDSTVESLPSQMHCLGLSAHFAVTGREAAWHLHALAEDGAKADDNNRIYSAGRAVRVAAWLVHNELVRPDAALSLIVREGTVGSDDFLQAVAILREKFPPWDVTHDRHAAMMWSVGGEEDTVLFLNFENPRNEALVSADYILRTGWGEMRHFYVDVSGAASGAEQYLKIVWSLLREGNARADKLCIVGAETPLTQKHIANIRAALAAQKRQRPDMKKSRIDI